MPNETILETQTAFLTEQQVADFLCQSVRTLQKWRTIGQGPSFYKFGQSVRYNKQELMAWAAQRRVEHAARLSKFIPRI